MASDVTYAIVHDVPASWEQYERSIGALVEPAPEGLILHAAGKTDEGYRTIEVWENEEAWERFCREHHVEVRGVGGCSTTETTFRDFRPEHLVLSARVTPGRRQATEPGGDLP